MKGWGRVLFLVAGGILLGSGCGGRTSALGGEGYGADGVGADGSGADGSGNDGSGATSHTGGASSAGRPSRAGASTGGSVYVGGSGPVYPGGASYGGYATAGTGYGGGVPVAGYYNFGGAYPVGGYYGFGGTGYGGNPNQPAGRCCEAQDGPSCTPRSVAKCVCNSAPYCCDKIWDERCAGLVEPLGCGYCDRNDCQSCINDSCGGQLAQCFQDFGCLSIYTCMDATGCQAFQCYNEQQCKGVIDQWGGPAGYSMSVLLQAFTCAVQSGCPCN